MKAKHLFIYFSAARLCDVDICWTMRPSQKGFQFRNVQRSHFEMTQKIGFTPSNQILSPQSFCKKQRNYTAARRSLDMYVIFFFKARTDGKNALLVMFYQDY